MSIVPQFFLIVPTTHAMKIYKNRTITVYIIINIIGISIISKKDKYLFNSLINYNFWGDNVIKNF